MKPLINQSEQLLRYRLTKTDGVGPIIFKKLIDHFGCCSQVYKQRAVQLSSAIHLSEKLAHKIMKKEEPSEAETWYKRHNTTRIATLNYGAKNYPKLLSKIANPPSILYQTGATYYGFERSVGIVGTRKASPDGIFFVEKLIEDLAPYAVAVVSGLAYGIDIAAHKAALKNKLPTIAVLGSSLNNLYPYEHKKIAEEIVQKKGILMTEYPIGTKTLPTHFPMRNRIIAGLTDATIIIEAGAKSGALITAFWANQYDREVFAVPGHLGNPNTVGCHHLIKSHQAHLITSAKDLVYLLNWKAVTNSSINCKQVKSLQLSNKEKRVVDCLSKEREGSSTDRLYSQTGLSMTELNGILLELEMKGIISSLAGSRYRLRW